MKYLNKNDVLFAIRIILNIYLVSAIVLSVFVFSFSLISGVPIDGEALPFLLYFAAPTGSVITLVIVFIYALFEKKIWQWIYLTGITAISIIITVISSALLEAGDYSQVVVYMVSTTIVAGMATYIADKR